MPDTKTTPLHAVMALAVLTEAFDPSVQHILKIDTFGQITIQLHPVYPDAFKDGNALAVKFGIGDPFKRKSHIVGDTVQYWWKGDVNVQGGGVHEVQVVAITEWTNGGPQQNTPNGTMISRPVHGG